MQFRLDEELMEEEEKGIFFPSRCADVGAALQLTAAHPSCSLLVTLKSVYLLNSWHISLKLCGGDALVLAAASKLFRDSKSQRTLL